MVDVLVFGGNGQDGVYLRELGRERNWDVALSSRSSVDFPCDVGDADAVNSLIRSLGPRMVFQLAAESTTQHEGLYVNHAAIATGTLHVLEAVRQHLPESRVFIPGSGLQFVNDGLPIAETHPFVARDVYCLSRIHAVYSARYYRALGLRVVVGYLFHHDSPIRRSRHLARRVADCVTRIASGSAERLLIGDLDVGREWGFARDIAQGMITLTVQDNVFEATIGTGRAYTVRDWVSTCFQHAGLDWRDHVDVDPHYQAPFQRLVSDAATMRGLGWSATTSICDTARMMVGALGS